MENEVLDSGVLLKAIPNVDPLDYKAGSDGFIYSKRRSLIWKKLKGSKHHAGYYLIHLHDASKTKAVHRLICLAFSGLPEKQQKQTRHLDGNKTNNKPENLRFGTVKENHQDAIKHGTVFKTPKGENHPNAKLTNKETIYVKFITENMMCSQRKLASILGVSRGCIQGIKRKNISHIIEAELSA